MSPEEEKTSFSKENIDFYLKEVAKEYRRHERNGIPAEIILIGGSSVVLNYGFRDSTLDMDGYFQAGSALQDAINKVGDQHNLPRGWLNDDFNQSPIMDDINYKHLMHQCYPTEVPFSFAEEAVNDYYKIVEAKRRNEEGGSARVDRFRRNYVINAGKHRLLKEKNHAA